MKNQLWIASLGAALVGRRTARPGKTLAGRSNRPRPGLAVTPLEERAVPSFTPAATFDVGGYALGLATADFNGDGKVDAATASTNSDNVSVLLGNGDGTFAVRRVQHPGTQSTVGSSWHESLMEGVAEGAGQGASRPDGGAAGRKGPDGCERKSERKGGDSGTDLRSGAHPQCALPGRAHRAAEPAGGSEPSPYVPLGV